MARPVAVKIMHRELAANITLVKRFHREALSSSKLTHPNTIKVHDFGQGEDGSLYTDGHYGIYGRQLDSSGVAIEPQQLLSDGDPLDGSGTTHKPVVLPLSGGSLVVGWQGKLGTEALAAMTRLFDATDQPVTIPTALHPVTSHKEQSLVGAVLGDGSLVFVWLQYQMGFPYGKFIQGQRLDPSGNKVYGPTWP